MTAVSCDLPADLAAHTSDSATLCVDARVVIYPRADIERTKLRIAKRLCHQGLSAQSGWSFNFRHTTQTGIGGSICSLLKPPSPGYRESARSLQRLSIL